MPVVDGRPSLNPRGNGSDSPRPRRVAIVHDWLTGMRGGERCLEVVCELFPEAPLFTLLHLPGRVSKTIEDRRIVTSFVQRLPGAASHYRNYLPLFPAAVRRFDLRDYELVLSLSHCVAKAAPAPEGVLHLSYCFSPMRYIWDLYGDYVGPRAAWPTRVLMPPVAAALRRWDRDTSGVHEFAAISGHIARRIERIYGRSSEVIHPPVDVARFQPASSPDDFYLVVSALVPYKRIDLAVEAATRLRRRLLVVGTGPEAQRLRAVAGLTVEFLGWRPDEEVADLYARCRAVLFPAVEDYGIVPLEAAAAGRPTIALGRGGARETMIPFGDPDDAPTAVFFDQQTVASLSDAIVRFESNADRFDPRALRARAMQFDRPLFAQRMATWIERRWAAFCERRGAPTHAC